MKFNFKVLISALAFVAAGGAHAAINNAETGVSPFVSGSGSYDGGSDLVFYAWSGTGATAKSFVQDLGVQASGFLPSTTAANTTTSWSVNSAYSTFAAAAAATVRWGVFAIRSNTSGVDAAGQDWLFTTARAGTTASAIAGQKSGNIQAAVGSFDTFAAAAPSTAYYANTATSDNWATSLKANFGTKLNFNADNTVNTSNVAFYMMDAVAADTTPSTNTQFAGTFGFNGTALTYTVTAVPEPETYGMLLAGLALVGSIVRRRKSQA